jgi:protein-L-isoaspartate(D-aspartate) O-methyltransferase
MDFERARQGMVESQLKNRGISDRRVLKAMLEVPRHLFVPASSAGEAYADRPLPIGEEQTISQPYIVALSLEHLDVSPESRVFEVGTGSGYQTALLAYLAKDVYTIERIEGLLELAKGRLHALGIQNVRFCLGDGSKGWEDAAPFDRIVLSACSKEVPKARIGQLARLGRMVLPLGQGRSQWLTLVTKGATGKVYVRPTVPCVFVPLIADEGAS